MSSAPLPEEIARDATWLAQALDPVGGRVCLVAMSRESYRAASFLDDRLMQQAVDAQIIAWPDIEAAMVADLRTDARWIFHIGHVGSTLISRLLGEIEGVLGVREPRALRDLALVPPEVRGRYIGIIPKLMSRTFAENEFACVKTTSFVTEIAPALVPTGERALFMYAKARTYIASILAGENSLLELKSHEEYRRQRLGTRGIEFSSLRNDADRAAAAWACEMTALEESAERMDDRAIQWADFDEMLSDMPAGLKRTSEFFGFAADDTRLIEIAKGPLMRRYSKALEYEYTPALRYEVIADAERRHGREMGSALAMLDAASEKSPLLARALSRAREG
ncbi:MAG TPA: hypothetical protein VF098_12255 [Sphingomicrobium sp.]